MDSVQMCANAVMFNRADTIFHDAAKEMLAHSLRQIQVLI